MSASWTAIAAKYWKLAWIQSADDTDIVAEELRQFFGRNVPGNDELCTVIRWMAGPDGKQDKAPTLRELIRAVCIRRKAGRHGTTCPDSDRAPCAMCNKGWLSVYPALGPDGLTIEALSFETAVQVPCACSMGQNWRANCFDYTKIMTPEQLDKIDALQRLGLKQQAAARRAVL